MKLVCAPSGDHRNASRLEVRPQLAGFDEVVLLALARVQLQRELVPAEVVQRVTEPRRARCVDREHVLARWVSVGEEECLCFELATCTVSSALAL